MVLCTKGNNLIRAHAADINNWTKEEAESHYPDHRLSTVYQASPRDYYQWLAAAKAWQECLEPA